MTGPLPPAERDEMVAPLRADLLPALGVLVTVAVLGVPLGWVWSRLAPAEVVRVVDGRGGAATLLQQSEHRFDALAVFVLLGLAAGVLTGVAVWLLRQQRGPVVLLATVVGALLASWLAMRTGQALAAAEMGGALTAAAPGEFAPRPPVIESAWVVLAQPLGVALAYSTGASWHGSDDLGR